MRVLVVGGAGYIGAHIVDLLCEQNHEVIVFDNLSSGFEENLNKKSKLFVGDILKPKDLEDVFNKFSFDSVIHMAALKAAGESMIESDRYSENNIMGSINLISSSISHKIKKFIFSSSAAIYGEPQYNPIDEKHAKVPINHYGFTKLMVENYLSWIQKISNMKYVALRYFNAAGYTEKENLIVYKEKKPQNLLPIVMEVASGLRPKFQVFGDNYDTRDGTCVRDYINVLDLADAHIKALEYLETGDSCSINLSTNTGYSVLDVIDVAQKTVRTKIKYEIVDRRPGDPAILISSFKEAKNKLGWIPRKSSLEKIVSSMWKHYK